MSFVSTTMLSIARLLNCSSMKINHAKGTLSIRSSDSQSLCQWKVNGSNLQLAIWFGKDFFSGIITNLDSLKYNVNSNIVISQI